MRPSLLLAAASAQLASAELLATADWMGQAPQWPGKREQPRETGKSTVDEVNGWSPKPTDGPLLVGRANAMDVARRRDEWIRRKREETSSNTWLNDQTCGYRADFSSSAFTCETTEVCKTSGDVVACSASTDEDPFYTVCLDYSASKRGACKSADTKTGCCGSSTAPACITYIWPGSSQKFMYRCYRTPTIFTMLTVPQFVLEASSQTSSSAPGTTTDPTNTSGNDAQQTTDPASPTPEPSGSNVGAIVGGTIGGVAGVALIAGAIAFFVIRKRNQKLNSASGQPVAYSAVAPGDTSYPGASPQMNQFGAAAGSVGAASTLHPGTPYTTASAGPYSHASSATPPVPGVYDTQQQQQQGAYGYYDPNKIAEQQQQFLNTGQMGAPPGGYQPYPGNAPAPGAAPYGMQGAVPGAVAPGAPLQAAELSGEQYQPPVEMPVNSPVQR